MWGKRPRSLINVQLKPKTRKSFPMQTFAILQHILMKLFHKAYPIEGSCAGFNLALCFQSLDVAKVGAEACLL